MRLTVIGCSGSFPGPRSPASCYLVQAEHEGRTWSIAMDLGNGALGVLQRFVPPDDLDAVVISHLHPDHCLDLTGLYVTRRYRPSGVLEHPLAVYAPDGGREQIAAAYHGLGAEGMDDELAFHVLVDRADIQVGPFTVTPVAVRHPVPAFGFRIACRDRVLAYTGDTDSCSALGDLMQGADLVLADSAYVDGRDEVEGVHLSGSRAARAALGAGGVGRLMLTHIPAWNDPEVCRAQAGTVWPGAVELAEPEATYQV